MRSGPHRVGDSITNRVLKRIITCKGCIEKNDSHELNNMYTKRDCSTRNELKLKLNYNTTYRYELQEL
jgi:hypothetical protein